MLVPPATRTAAKPPKKDRPRGCPTQPVSRFAPLEALATRTTSRLGVHSILSCVSICARDGGPQGRHNITDVLARGGRDGANRQRQLTNPTSSRLKEKPVR